MTPSINPINRWTWANNATFTLVSSSTTRNPSPEMCRTPLTGRRREFWGKRRQKSDTACEHHQSSDLLWALSAPLHRLAYRVTRTPRRIPGTVTKQKKNKGQLFGQINQTAGRDINRLLWRGNCRFQLVQQLHPSATGAVWNFLERDPCGGGNSRGSSFVSVPFSSCLRDASPSSRSSPPAHNKPKRKRSS